MAAGHLGSTMASGDSNCVPSPCSRGPAAVDAISDWQPHHDAPSHDRRPAPPPGPAARRPGDVAIASLSGIRVTVTPEGLSVLREARLAFKFVETRILATEAPRAAPCPGATQWQTRSGRVLL